MKVAIIGHGYVGKAMDRFFRRNFDIAIYGIATQPDRDAVRGADLAVICVPTPQTADGAADVSAVEDAVAWLDVPLIVIKSTVPPGTTDRLAKEYGKAVHFSPEFIGELSNFSAPWKYPDKSRVEMHSFTIVGGERASDVLEFFQRGQASDAHFVACAAVEAELAKYMENTFFALKVTFCNEFFDIIEAFGADYKRVRELWLLDPRFDPSHTLVFRHDRGFGGKCLPKDIAAIVAAAQANGCEPALLKAVIACNKARRSGVGAEAPPRVRARGNGHGHAGNGRAAV